MRATVSVVVASLLVWTLLILPGPVTVQAQVLTLEIADIQGAAHTSPRVGQTVRTEGIITVKRSTSFWIQDPTPDDNSATSEGLLVFGISTAALAVGDLVQVQGRVTEFRPGGGASANLTTTEITGPSLTVTKQSSGNPLPAPTVIGAGGRVPPTMVIEDDAAGSVETSGVFDPAFDGIDFYESLEGMRVQINNAVAASARNRFGEITVLADDGANAGVRSPRGGIVIRPTDFNPERIIVDDELLRPLTSTPFANVGDHFAAPLVGVVDYSFGNFKVQLPAVPDVVPAGLALEATGAPADQELAVATFNVLNLSPQDTAQMAELAGQIVNNLRSPDLIALQEMQDASGEVDDGVTDGAPTFEALIAAIEAAGGPTYEFRQIDPLNNQDGGVPGGNIRVGFLFHTQRGLSFIDRPGGDTTTPTRVLDHPSGPRLSLSPGRVDPQNEAWFLPEGTRKPLAGEFRFRGKKLFVIVNHLKSKTQDHPLFGRFQPPIRITEVQRHTQAQIVNDFVDEILAFDPNANVIVLGDMNDFEFSDALATLRGNALVNLTETLPVGERYTFVFDGNSQTLDHILLSNHLFDRFPHTYDILHVNAEFAVQASDHEPVVARIRLIGRP